MLTVPLKSRRRERALAVQKFQHAIPAVPLLFTRFSERRRVMRLDDDGLHIAGRLFQTFRARWEDITSIKVEDHLARIKTRDGRERELNLADLHGAAEVRAALAEAVTRADEAKTRR